jgi:hypothetical protein
MLSFPNFLGKCCEHIFLTNIVKGFRRKILVPIYIKMETIFSAFSAEKYKCAFCNIICSKKNDWTRHLLTGKHKRNCGAEKELKILPKKHTCKCGRNYATKSGLWKHTNICDSAEDDNKLVNNMLKDNFDFKTLILEVVKNNSELQKQTNDLQKANLDLHAQMLAVCQTSNNTNINSNNKTFNLQVFLNEQCKDAMNIMDFVDSFKLQFDDLEQVGELGYVEGLTNIIMKKLNEMEVCKRPIHCSDAKRETLYVKDDNVWEKEKPTYDKLRKAIKYISKKNSDLIPAWQVNNPEANNFSSHVNDQYLQIIKQSMGGSGEIENNENKIIKRLAKIVLIDKV